MVKTVAGARLLFKPSNFLLGCYVPVGLLVAHMGMHVPS
jgi:hypothetical protein